MTQKRKNSASSAAFRRSNSELAGTYKNCNVTVFLFSFLPCPERSWDLIMRGCWNSSASALPWWKVHSDSFCHHSKKKKDKKYFFFLINVVIEVKLPQKSPFILSASTTPHTVPFKYKVLLPDNWASYMPKPSFFSFFWLRRIAKWLQQITTTG